MWRRVRDSNPRFLLGTRHFECRTFDRSDNSPYLFLSIFSSGNLLKNSLERKQERKQKIFDFEFFGVEMYQRKSGGRKSQVLPKFRVSPVMTTSIPLHINLSDKPYWLILYHRWHHISRTYQKYSPQNTKYFSQWLRQTFFCRNHCRCLISLLWNTTNRDVPVADAHGAFSHLQGPKLLSWPRKAAS